MAIAKEKIKALEASEEELKEQVAQLGIEFTAYKRATDLAYKGSELETQEQLIALQAKSAALVDASQLAADQIRKYDYTPARSTLLVELAAFKGDSNVMP